MTRLDGSSPALNPYAAPLAKPGSAGAAEVQHRNLVMIVVLSTVTLFVGYPIYLCYQWARELNGLAGRERHPPGIVLLLSIATLGLAGMIYECVFAQEIAEHLARRGHKHPMPNLVVWVASLNAAAFLLALTGIGVFAAIPCGMAATCLVQAELNKLAAS